MEKRPVFDFKLGQTPRLRDKQEWMEVAADTRALGAATLENARVLAIDHVEPGPWQVRRNFRADKMSDLIESVRSQGVLEPILVRASDAGRYQIVAGERRYRAACEAGLRTIPALILEIDDLSARVISLMENLQREDLNELERAEGLTLLKQMTGRTWDEVGHMLGITKRHVLHLVSLTRLPAMVQALVRDGTLSAKHGRLLAYVKDPQVQVALAELIAERRLNAQQTAEAVKRIGSQWTGVPAGMEDRDAALREHLSGFLAAIAEPAAVPTPAATHITAGDIQQLSEAVNEVRRAIAAFPARPVEDSAAVHLHNDLDALIQAAQALLARVPLPSPA